MASLATMVVLAQSGGAGSESSFVQGFREVMSTPGVQWLGVFGFVIVLVALRSVVSVVRTVSRERTRREIAAFIAEGSMTPEQGERLMKSGNDTRCG